MSPELHKEIDAEWATVSKRIWPLQNWLADHPRTTDLCVAFGCAVFQIIVAALSGNTTNIPLLITATLALLWRSKYPVAVLLIIVGVNAAATVLTPPIRQTVPFLVALYTVASHRGFGSAALGYCIGVLVPILTTLLQNLGAAKSFSPVLVDTLGLIALTAGIAASRTRQRNQVLAQLWEERAQNARASERMRIAADMHDVVAHSISTMIALANGASSAWQKHPERSAKALRNLSHVGRTALTDMNRVLGLLPENTRTGQNTEATSELQSLEDLVETFRSTGMPVVLSRSGEHPLNNDELHMTIYRIVQESLTNALRYAKDATFVKVDISTRGEFIDITITDDAPVSDTQSVGSGLGLYGIAIRAANHNGTCNAGPLPGGGWQTRVSLHQENLPKDLSK